MNSALIAIIVVVTVICLLIGLGFYIFMSIALGKIFKKAGQPLWKAFIPYYNTYIQYKITWKTKWFWALFLPVTIASILFSLIVSSEIIASFTIANTIISVLSTACGIFLFLLSFAANVKLSWSMVHGIPYAIGITLLPIIFIPILGFGKSEFIAGDIEKLGRFGF